MHPLVPQTYPRPHRHLTSADHPSAWRCLQYIFGHSRYQVAMLACNKPRYTHDHPGGRLHDDEHRRRDVVRIVQPRRPDLGWRRMSWPAAIQRSSIPARSCRPCTRRRESGSPMRVESPRWTLGHHPSAVYMVIFIGVAASPKWSPPTTRGLLEAPRLRVARPCTEAEVSSRTTGLDRPHWSVNWLGTPPVVDPAAW